MIALIFIIGLLVGVAITTAVFRSMVVKVTDTFDTTFLNSASSVVIENRMSAKLADDIRRAGVLRQKKIAPNTYEVSLYALKYHGKRTKK